MNEGIAIFDYHEMLACVSYAEVFEKLSVKMETCVMIRTVSVTVRGVKMPLLKMKQAIVRILQRKSLCLMKKRKKKV